MFCVIKFPFYGFVYKKYEVKSKKNKIFKIMADPLSVLRLLFLLKNVSHSHPVYVRLATAAKISAVRRPDREKLLAYLYGDISSSVSVDENALIEIPTKVEFKVKKSAEHGSLESSTKKVCPEDNYIQKGKKEMDEPNKETLVSTVPVETVMSSSDAICLEKIAAIKCECFAEKISTNEEDFVDSVQKCEETDVVLDL